MNIEEIHGYQVLDTRGRPAIGSWLLFDGGNTVSATVPTGLSLSQFESKNQNDNFDRVMDCFATVLTPLLCNKNLKIEEIEKILSDEVIPACGSQVALAVSIAVHRASAHNSNLPLYSFLSQRINQKPKMPLLFFNLINGGMHAQSSLVFQELMIVPNVKSARESLDIALKINKQLYLLFEQKNMPCKQGDEGGLVFAANGNGLEQERKALELLIAAIERAGYTPGEQVGCALDIAASTFFSADTNSYVLGNQELKRSELIAFYQMLAESYPIFALEDPFDQNDEEGWKHITSLLGANLCVIGDDIFATQADRIKFGLSRGLANGSIIKPNQAGTVTKTLEAVIEAGLHDGKILVSHRSGETDDTFIADLAYGIGADFFKCGAPVHKERMAKYDRLIQIEASL